MQNRRTEEQIQKDRVQAYELHLTGAHSLRDIADIINTDREVKISYETVRSDIAAARLELSRINAKSVRAVRDERIAFYEGMIRELYGGWRRSQEDFLETREVGDRVTTITRAQSGDVRFLSEINKVAKQIDNLLGVGASVGIETSLEEQLAAGIRSGALTPEHVRLILPSGYAEQVLRKIQPASPKVIEMEKDNG